MTNNDEITIKDIATNKEVNNKELKEYVNLIAPNIEDDVKKMLFNYLVTGGLNRHKAKEISDNYKLL